MAQESQYVCDGCGDICHGKQRGQFYHRDYFQVKGAVVLQLMNKDSNELYYQYLSRPLAKPPAEEMTFCLKPGIPCMERWMDRRRGEIEFRRRQMREDDLRRQRREELEAEERARMINGG
jgi:uncharacterized cysteine cluster protein YcgN (CxxCxxCC family)